MKEYQSLSWYAARIKPHLPKEAFKPVPSRLLGGLAFLVVIVAGFLAVGLLELNLWLNLLIAFVLGACYASLGFLGHEILHGTVVRKPWLRDLLGAISFWPLCTGPSLWRKWHNMNHHVHTQDEHKDPDAWITAEHLEKNKLVRLMYRIPFFIRATFSLFSLAMTFTVHSSRMFKVYIKDFDPRNRPKVWLQLILPWASWIGLLFWIGFTNWIFVFLLPLLIANFIVMSYISTNHRLNPLVPVNDPLANSLSVTVPKWVDAIHFNFSYHTEHHLFPSISPKYYPLVKEQIKQRWPERYHEMPFLQAMIALFKTPRLYYQQNELVDPRAGNRYGSLGHGLDPNNISYQNPGEALPTSEKPKNKDV
ncbi:fatty acid desaturase family protein [Alkalihalobacterium chitinilyticum]|uniref:Acyl-CoA desaturase n=1 Tax=Alkalihalobacterium chitinilyticum TaxID=2980103 RepID=A0ABT5VGP0_9BACI|nr:acyl-CoA desaturase [Alkalihalobacterium chitinilyticum]MDE5414622.1 acyl-CoA desaturase [Alkalihalobacterium chitinilyticum]